MPGTFDPTSDPFGLLFDLDGSTARPFTSATIEVFRWAAGTSYRGYTTLKRVEITTVDPTSTGAQTVPYLFQCPGNFQRFIMLDGGFGMVDVSRMEKGGCVDRGYESWGSGMIIPLIREK